MKQLSHGDLKRVRSRLRFLYGDQADKLAERFYYLVGRYGVTARPNREDVRKWNEQDVVLISYADNVKGGAEVPLEYLKRFCVERLKEAVKTVHLLPFYPWSSDDGFSVIDYKTVDPGNGSWKHVENLGKEFDLAFDLVLNHCSAKSGWFKDFTVGIDPAKHYFLEMDPKTDLSSVFRPRTTPLLSEKRTRYGTTTVWTTFSSDQVDLNWQNPDLLFEFLDILFWYISKGVRILRLDAVAFCWKRLGTSCLHLPETHEIVKLLHDICGMVAPEVIILTETNVPHKDNVSYFGNGDEAHMVYNFSLAPLLLEALLTHDGTYLNQWAQGLEYPSSDCTFLNFTASHDGVGVGPLKGLLPESRFEKLIATVKEKGGEVSEKSNPDGSMSPYELNITYASALMDDEDPEAGWQRFFCSQGIALALKGIPAVYFHSLMGTLNNLEGVKQTKRARTINRYKYQWKELNDIINDVEDGGQGTLFRRYIQLLRRRALYPAFHPNSEQEIIEIGTSFFALRRRTTNGEQEIHCLHNLTNETQKLTSAMQKSLGLKEGGYSDIVSGKTIKAGKRIITLKPYRFVWLVER